MTTRNIIIAVVIIAVVALALLAYSFFKPPEEASGPLEAVPIAVDEQLATEAEPTVESEAPAEQPTEDSPVPTPEPVEEISEPTEAPAAVGPVVFEIVQEGSEARFIIDEVLRGDDVTVVGSTDQVAGEIAIDAANPANSQIGTILVNARGFTTDNSFRNNAIKNRILRTNDFEFVTFEPTGIQGLPEIATVGEPFAFQVTGNLTVTDVTREVMFDVTVTPIANDRIEGLATTTILYQDFNLSIPDSPSVDTIEDEVILQLQFVAMPK